MRPVGRGHRGKQVVDIQTRLAALGYYLGREGADGFFGPTTEQAIRCFQQTRLLLSDGIVGDNTWTELVEAGYQPGDRLLYLREPFMRGDDVLLLQRRLGELGFDSGPVDGIFSPLVEVAMTEFQRNAGLCVDGIVGETTFERLRQIRQVDGEAFVAGIPDRMDGYIDCEGLAGLRITIDPAHGGLDRGGVALGGLIEKDANLVLGLQLAGLLEGKGAEAILLRDDDTTLGLYDRTQAASACEPHFHLCLHHSVSHCKTSSGTACYYFENWAYFSRTGKRLAGYIVDAVSRRLGRVDLHTHGRNYAALREVKPLSVVVDLGFLSNPEEGPTLVDPDVIAEEAAAIVEGVEAYLARR
jgi:N-acetylmuramoyl-L-alanine amidase